MGVAPAVGTNFGAGSGAQAKSIFTGTSALAQKLYLASGRRIRILGVNFWEVSSGTTVATAVDGLTGNVHNAVTPAQSWATSGQSRGDGVSVVLGGVIDEATIAGLKDYASANNSHVSINLISTPTTASRAKVPATGRILGLAARAPVGQHLGQVAPPGRPFIASKVGLTDGNKGYTEYNETLFQQLDQKRYLVPQSRRGGTEVFLNDTSTLSSPTSDFNSIERTRVIDKAIRIALSILDERVNEQVPVEDNGNISAPYLDFVSGLVEDTITETMVVNGDISPNPAFLIDPTQNVIASSTWEGTLSIIPTAIGKRINLKVGFNNPAR